MARTWSAVLARIGVPTGDGRIIAPGALTSRDLPLPLMWQRTTGDGHSGAVTVGAIETLVIDNESGMVTGRGRFLDVRGSAEAQAQTEAGVTGPSVDIFDDIDIVEVQKLIEAGVIGPNVVDNMDDLEYVMDDAGMIVITQGRLAGATLVSIPAFADVSIQVDDGEPAEPVEVWDESKARPMTAEEGVMIGESFFTASASPFASAATSVLPPVTAFMRPDVDRLTPLTVSDTGSGWTKVFGHIAPWGACHVGLPGCVTAPSSPSGYSYFMQGEQQTEGGEIIPVGVMVAGPRHADAQLAYRAAQNHYDDPSAAVAKVVAGEDEFGIWVAGWILPGASEDAVNVFRSNPVSGDWRRVGGNLELIAVCSVNTAGFPIPKARVAFSAGYQRTLIGTFGITPVAGTLEQAQTGESFVKTTDEEARAKWAWATATERWR